ncbi:lytic transglycosylase domain-containing protein [Tepidimonas charontis]|uniref:Transglycosylase SLT domain protein n=1 Tax=Tepidimonas charontis TaxID=2267262 RepID=A0A554X515_9BURK|nr:lytic transglycosylase domain-containing protein [Tepidimonas charontis]TSE30913.1 Transglycosylase SLT domain protein [Tepidimonas charontis]
MLAEALAALAFVVPGDDVVARCLDAAQRHFRTPPGLVHAIARVESGLNPRAVNTANRNGTHDIGLMQVNSSHLPRLRGAGIDREHLFNPCINAFAGAEILARNLGETDGAIVPALAMYNTGRTDSSVGARYAQKVLAAWGAARDGATHIAPTRRPAITAAPLLVAQSATPFAPRW